MQEVEDAAKLDVLLNDVGGEVKDSADFLAFLGCAKRP